MSLTDIPLFWIIPVTTPESSAYKQIHAWGGEGVPLPKRRIDARQTRFSMQVRCKVCHAVALLNRICFAIGYSI